MAKTIPGIPPLVVNGVKKQELGDPLDGGQSQKRKTA